MARVNVDDIALTDPRFAILAKLMGFDDPDFALGKMVRVWNHCTERETHVLTKDIIVGLFRFREEAPEWLVRADLAEEVDGGFRIKGTSGRIEWITKKRASARKNGRKGGRPSGNRSKTNVGSAGLQPETPLTLTPALAPLGSSIEEPSSSSDPPKPPPEKPKKERARDPIFDAIAEVTGTDPKVSATHIAKVSNLLKKAEPPYTPDEIRALPRFLSWAREQNRKPTIGEVEKYIGLVRNGHGSGQGVRSGARIFDEEGRYGTKEPIIAGGDFGDHAGAVQAGDAHPPPQAS